MIAAALALGACTASIAGAPPAHAASYQYLGPKTCGSGSWLYSVARANNHVEHQVVTTAGQIAVRTFANTSGAYQVSTFYTKMQGTVVRDGHSFVQQASAAFPATVSSASLNCDR
jgi:hypothetical protein